MFEEFYEKYEPQEQEAIVLIRNCLGAGYNSSGDFWEMLAVSLGMVFCDTGKADLREGRLNWPLTKEEMNTDRGWGRFQKGQICRIKMRKLQDAFVPAQTSPEQFNSWAVLEVMELAASCPQLETVWEEYQKPVTIADGQLGALKLNREFGQLEGSILWNGVEISLFLEIDPEERSSWDTACSAAQQLVTNSEHWDRTMREFAAAKLTQLAGEWQAEDDESESAVPITQERFAARITLTELSVTSEGEFTAYYDDDDLFWGHAIEVCGSLDEGCTSADITG